MRKLLIALLLLLPTSAWAMSPILLGGGVAEEAASTAWTEDFEASDALSNWTVEGGLADAARESEATSCDSGPCDMTGDYVAYLNYSTRLRRELHTPHSTIAAVWQAQINNTNANNTIFRLFSIKRKIYYTLATWFSLSRLHPILLGDVVLIQRIFL